jgi:hypothetical protein
MDNERNEEMEPVSEDEQTEREWSFSRRALVKAGWTVPVVLAVAPAVAFAQSGIVHGDHTDHVDGNVHTDHTDHVDSTTSDRALKRSIVTLEGALGALRAL